MNLHIYTILAKNSELVQFLFNSILYLDIFVWLGRVLVIILSLQYSKKKKKQKTRYRIPNSESCDVWDFNEFTKSPWDNRCLKQ